jgi:hypothetical protein
LQKVAGGAVMAVPGSKSYPQGLAGAPSGIGVGAGAGVDVAAGTGAGACVGAGADC